MDPDPEQDPDPDPLFHETDPRIRINIKMKRIRNTAFNYCIESGIVLFRQKIEGQASVGNDLKRTELSYQVNYRHFLNY